MARTGRSAAAGGTTATAMDASSATLERALAPVEAIPADRAERGPQPGIALCLSGGGARAMLFHAGALIRLNELGLLSELDRVSSVSGGSITAGVLARHWAALDVRAGEVSPALISLVVEPLRRLARRLIDVPAWVYGTFVPGSSPARRFADVLDGHLYGRMTLAELPDRPRFVFNATNIGSGVLWRMSKPYMADYRVGMVPHPKVRLALAVAASAGFPPFLSPLRLRLPDDAYAPGSYELGTPEFRREPHLGDGGIYDNLGLETAWKRYRTILVSDAGGTLAANPRPPGDLVFQVVRVTNVIDRQVRALRKRMLIDGYQAGLRTGAYWGIRSDVANYSAPAKLDCPVDATTALANVATRMAPLPPRVVDRLINWGYAVADAAIRSHYLPNADPPNTFPYPNAPLAS